MRMTVLASGSKGNCTVFSSATTSILIDAGLSCRETLKRMRFAGEDPDKLQGILITHEHADHVYGLDVLARKLGIPIYFTGATYQGWKRVMKHSAKRRHPMAKAAAAAAAAEQAVESGSAEQLDLATLEVAGDTAQHRVEFFESGRPFSVGNIEVLPFTIPHDAADPVGFVLRTEGLKIGMCTDLGYMPASVREHLRGCHGMMIESNHDLEMLRLGPYPWSVKQRVMSRLGHLSNDSLAEFFTTDFDRNAAFVVLAHLSEANNHPEIARQTAERALGAHQQALFGRSLHLAQQSEPLPPIQL